MLVLTRFFCFLPLAWITASADVGALRRTEGGAQPTDFLPAPPADFDSTAFVASEGITFERLLGDVQAAWSNEDIAKLHTLATPEMVSYFSKDLEENKARNVTNKTSNVKLLQGDLAEAWREGDSEYATVAMRYSLVDTMLERGTGRQVGGSTQPEEITEVWTFVRQRGGNWELSAIQQTN